MATSFNSRSLIPKYLYKTTNQKQYNKASKLPYPVNSSQIANWQKTSN